MSTDPYFPFTPDKWWPDLFEVLTRSPAGAAAHSDAPSGQANAMGARILVQRPGGVADRSNGSR